MKHIYTICLALLFTTLIFSQNRGTVYGKYSMEELEMIKYPKDSIAEAVVLSDIGKSYFVSYEGRFHLYFERTTRYKVLSEAGLKYAEISIPFYIGENESEEIVKLKGNTVNFENRFKAETQLDTKNSYIEKHNKHWSSKKFAMPNVKVGSIFEVSYLIKSPFFFNLRSWEFQSTIPVVYSEYTTKMVPFYEYVYLLQGASKLDEYKCEEEKGMTNRYGSVEYHDMNYLFVMRDVPAFRDENFITAIDDYILKLRYQLSVIHNYYGGTTNIMTTWPKLCSELLDNDYFGKYIKQCTKKAEEIVLTLPIDTMSQLSKVKYIDNYVKTNFSWDENQSFYTYSSPKEFLLKKTGNTAEINLFLLSLLKAAKINVQPIILSTRDHGKIYKEYPLTESFNYVIVLVEIDQLYYLLDATEPLCSFNELPTRCINDVGLIIQKDKEEWVNIQNNAISSTSYTFELNPILSTDSINRKCKLVTTGSEGRKYRRLYASSRNDLKKQLLGSDYLSSDTIVSNNLYDVEKPFELTFNNIMPNDVIENKIIIRPFSNAPITENPLKQSSRKYPIDFIYKNTNKFRSTITIPKGYKLIKKAENATINNDKIQLIYMVNQLSSDLVQVEGLYKFKKETYPATDYNQLKLYFDTIVDKFNQSIILEKE